MEILPEDLTKIKIIGKGSFGDVYLARSRMFGEVAVKQTFIQGNQSIFGDFKKESKIISELNSPYIIRYFGTCKSPEGEMIVMEYASKGTLYEFIGNIRENNVDFKWESRYQVALDIARGLFLMHTKGILHRDIKSLNVLFDENMKAKISDFGLSVIKTQSQITSGVKSSRFGTLLWKAPETFSIRHKYNEKSDIYSLGIVFWEIASCQIPYSGYDEDTIKDSVKSGERLEVPDSCPMEFKNLIDACWNHDPNKRPPIGDIVDTLYEICEKENKWKFTKPNDFETDVFEASAKGKLNSIIYHLANGTSVNQEFLFDVYDGIEGMKNSSLLLFASRYGHLSIVEYLIKQGAFVNFHNISIQTPLHFASENGHVNVVEFLVKSGSDIEAKEVDDWTALHIASQNGHVNVVEFLVKSGSNIDARNKDNRTALYIASQNGHAKVVEFLGKLGSNNYSNLMKSNKN